MTKEPAIPDLDRRRPKLPENSAHRIEPTPRVEERLEQLGAATIDGAAILPRNFDNASSLDDCIFESTTADLVTIGKRAGLDVSTLGAKNRKSIHEHDVATIGVVILLVMENANNFATYVEFFNLIANYSKRRGHGEVCNHTEVVQEVIVTNGSVSRRIIYRGPLSGISSIVTAGQEALNAAVEKSDI